MGRRSASSSKDGLKRGAWTAHEDQILKDYISIHGEGKWRTIPKEAGLKRCGKSCRLRWLNYLKPDIKRGNISPDEEDLIIRLHKLLGNRWSLIAGRLPGRTDNEIKNYYNTTLKKKMRGGESKRKKSNHHVMSWTEEAQNAVAEEDTTTNGKMGDTSEVRLELKCNYDGLICVKSREEYTTEFNFGEVMMSDFQDSDLWKVCQTHQLMIDERDHNDNDNNKIGVVEPNNTAATARLPFDHPFLFSEDVLKDWI